VTGSGPPLLMFSPGGFDATLENWTSFSIYRRLNLLDHLSKSYTCIAFDRRESVVPVVGSSASDGTTTPRRQGLLDHLGIERAHLMAAAWVVPRLRRSR